MQKIRISKEEWEKFQEWLKSKNQKATEEPEPLELEEIEDYSDLALEEKPETYICGNCGYESETIFEICPKCKAKNKFD